MKARCWSCGSELDGGLPEGLGGVRQVFTCSACTSLMELKGIREKLEDLMSQSPGAEINIDTIDTEGLENRLDDLAFGLDDIVNILKNESGNIQNKLNNITNMIEWGFEEIVWHFDQMSGILRGIDATLKTPSLTRANEWRQIAEQLRVRGVLDESEKFFLKSLEANPLDYRTYIGLGKTYLRIGKADAARAYWEKSLPHAPQKEIDFKSYSYRLIGRLYFCEEKYQQAVLASKRAIKFSPNYRLGHYDHAQYCAIIGNKKDCFYSLEIATLNNPFLFEIAIRNDILLNFGKEEVLQLLRGKLIYCLEKMITPQRYYRRPYWANGEWNFLFGPQR
jgi:tetratricopeptide (TPR) repeat protein